VKDKEERKGKKGGEQELCKCHLEEGALRTAREKRICLEFIKLYSIRTYTEGEKGLRAQNIYFMLEKWREYHRICTNR
jgi:hypothetical protein